jgi:hypothetical protein
MDAASFVLPVKMKLKTKVSMLPVILQLMALAMDRGWESPVRINGGFMFVPICSEWPPMELSVRANGAVADDCNR